MIFKCVKIVYIEKDGGGGGRDNFNMEMLLLYLMFSSYLLRID